MKKKFFKLLKVLGSLIRILEVFLLFCLPLILLVVLMSFLSMISSCSHSGIFVVSEFLLRFFGGYCDSVSVGLENSLVLELLIKKLNLDGGVIEGGRVPLDPLPEWATVWIKETYPELSDPFSMPTEELRRDAIKLQIESITRDGGGAK